MLLMVMSLFVITGCSTDADIKSAAKAITAFTFPTSLETTINENAHTIAVKMPYGTDVTALTPTITHTGVSISPQGPQNFSSPVNYVVTAANGTTQIYTVTVTVTAYNYLPKTGQTTSYATGDDGDLEKGVAWPGTRFTDNSDGTIRDNLTGLVWLKNTSCFGQDTWANALTYANTLNSGECGLTDGSVEGQWRLPNREELRSLINYGQINTATWLNGLGFSNLSEDVGSGWYWSSTTCAAAAPANAWIMNMTNGRWTNTAKTDNFYYVWAVRSGSAGVVNLPKTGQTSSYAAGDDGDLEKGVAWPGTRFTDNMNGTITDNLTGLVWLKIASCIGQQTWANGLTDANTLNSGECGLTDGSVEGDWRMPNANELHSLINFEQMNPAGGLSGEGFAVPNWWYVVSTTNASDTATYAWTIMMGNGNMDNLNIKANAADYVWAVRDAK